MKLIECYIENFGKLSSYNHTFSDGLNVIIGKNGCGKTTLSVFIKSMLYGIETKKTRGEETDRKRYLPWQGGRCGGSLTFESDGKLYRIERTFGEKPSADAFAIYNAETGALTSDFSENVGEELFDIDADGFERTVFLSERKFSVNGNNQTISAKLSNLVGVDGDMGSLDGAIDELERKEKYYRHRRGKGGLIGDIKTKISELDIEILDITRKKDICADSEAELAEITAKISEAEKLKESIEKQRLSDEYMKEYKAKTATLKAYEEKLEKEKQFFSQTSTSSEEIHRYEQKRNQARLLMQSAEAERKVLEQHQKGNCDEIEKYISILNSTKNSNNANKTCLLWVILAILTIVASVVLGIFIHPLLYTLTLLSSPFIYIGVRSSNKVSSKMRGAINEAIQFISSETSKAPDAKNLDSILLEMKAERNAEKRERERLLISVTKKEAEIKALTEEYEAFLSKFSFSAEDRFSELREHLNTYEALTVQVAILSREAELYAIEHGIRSQDSSSAVVTVFSEKAVSDTDTELRSLRSVKYLLESRLSSLYDEISKEDELKERKLELADSLSEAETSHKVTVKAAEHLISAKERLTSKYLGKMRKAFDYYIDRIGSENGKSFTLDTDFSLRKTENGLTNSINSYSLGTKELYALITRLSLIDALYEKNPPFILFDDPFCHFDDKKCEAALDAVKKISKDKQIIYLTCANSRTPV